VIPLYGFLEGDTIGLLVLADERDTMTVLADKLQRSAQVRVPGRPRMHVEVRGSRLHPTITVGRAGLEPLDRFDVREGD
jgi:hypothetical protein